MRVRRLRVDALSAAERGISPGTLTHATDTGLCRRAHIAARAAVHGVEREHRAAHRTWAIGRSHSWANAASAVATGACWTTIATRAAVVVAALEIHTGGTARRRWRSAAADTRVADLSRRTGVAAHSAVSGVALQVHASADADGGVHGALAHTTHTTHTGRAGIATPTAVCCIARGVNTGASACDCGARASALAAFAYLCGRTEVAAHSAVHRVALQISTHCTAHGLAPRTGGNVHHRCLRIRIVPCESTIVLHRSHVAIFTRIGLIIGRRIWRIKRVHRGITGRDIHLNHWNSHATREHCKRNKTLSEAKKRHGNYSNRISSEDDVNDPSTRTSRRIARPLRFPWMDRRPVCTSTPCARVRYPWVSPDDLTQRRCQIRWWLQRTLPLE